MAVEQVEVMQLGHLSHFRGQRERVWRMGKQRIGRNHDFMKLKVCGNLMKPKGRSVAYKVNLMAAFGKFLPQFRCHDAAAAIGWVAGDSNPHGLSFR
jgi:hypothetical protein